MKLTPKHLIIITLTWFILLSFIVGWAIKYKDFAPTFPYSQEVLSQYGPRWVTTWAHFDGVHYLTIIKQGYHGTGLIQAFFPLYPALVKIISLNGLLNPIAIGVFISLSCLTIALIYLSKLIQLDESKAVANKTCWLILLFPTSFFFASVYTESLFLMLAILTFYHARKRNWWIAGVAAALGSATRLVGIFLWLVVVSEFFQANDKTELRSLIFKQPARLIPIVLPVLGLGIYMIYLGLRFGDPLLFIHVQDQFGADRETGRLILLYQVYYRYVRMLATVDRQASLYYSIVHEFFAGIIGTLGSILIALKLRPSYAIFTFLCFITPTLTGTFSSLPRYLLTIFPLFILAAKYLPDWLYKVWLVISAILLAYNLMLFTQGLWVA